VNPEEERGQQRSVEGGPARPTVYDWEGKLALLFYTSGPGPDDLGESQIGELHSVSNASVLVEVNEIGVLARRLTRSEGEEGVLELSERPVFIPWSSINQIVPLHKLEE
jgi:hypothetical protein